MPCLDHNRLSFPPLMCLAYHDISLSFLLSQYAKLSCVIMFLFSTYFFLSFIFLFLFIVWLFNLDHYYLRERVFLFCFLLLALLVCFRSFTLQLLVHSVFATYIKCTSIYIHTYLWSFVNHLYWYPLLKTHFAYSISCDISSSTHSSRSSSACSWWVLLVCLTPSRGMMWASATCICTCIGPVKMKHHYFNLIDIVIFVEICVSFT